MSPIPGSQSPSLGSVSRSGDLPQPETLGTQRQERMTAPAGALGDSAQHGGLDPKLRSQLQGLISGPNNTGTKPVLPGYNVDEARLNGPDADALLEMLSAKESEISMKVLGSEIRSDQVRRQKASDERIKAIQESARKAEEAMKKEGGFWSKLFKGLGKALSIVTSAAAIVTGALLTKTGVGAPLGVFLMVQGASGIASTVMDIVDEQRIKDGKEPIGWRPTIGHGVTALLKECGVDEKTAMWVGVGVEIAVAVAVGVASVKASARLAKTVADKAAKTAETGIEMTDMSGKVAKSSLETSTKVADTSSKVTQSTQKVVNTTEDITETTGKISKASARVQAGSSVLQSGTTIGTSVVNWQVADLRREADLADARAEELKGQVARLMKYMQENTEFIKEISQRMQEHMARASESVQNTRDLSVSTAANMRLSG
jgi:hypothetical protein